MAKVTRRRRKVGVDPEGAAVYRDEGWKLRYVDPDGKEHLEVFRLKKQAEDRALEVEHGKRTGAYVDRKDGQQTFREYAEVWRSAQVHRASTRDQVESHLRLHVYPFIGNRPIASIRKTEVQAIIKARTEKLAPTTLETVSVWIRTVFKAAVEDRVITVSPARDLKLPTVEDKDPVVPFELEQIDLLAATLPAHLRAMVTIGAGLGLRSGEVLGLTVDRIDFLRREIKVDRQLITPKAGVPHLGPPKSKASRRVIPLPDSVGIVLAAHIAEFPTGPDGLLFTYKGQPYRRSRWGELWMATVATAGFPKGTRFHRLRHTYASMLIAAGCSVKVVQARLGHATAQETLDTYAHMWPGDDDRTREAIDAAFLRRSDQNRTNPALHSL